MRLGELRAAVRKTKKEVFIRAALGPGIPVLSLVLQKKALYDQLEAVFPDGKGQETGLLFDESNGQIRAEAGPAVETVAVPLPDDDSDPDDLLLV